MTLLTNWAFVFSGSPCIPCKVWNWTLLTITNRNNPPFKKKLQ